MATLAIDGLLVVAVRARCADCVEGAMRGSVANGLKESAKRGTTDARNDGHARARTEGGTMRGLALALCVSAIGAGRAGADENCESIPQEALCRGSEYQLCNARNDLAHHPGNATYQGFFDEKERDLRICRERLAAMQACNPKEGDPCGYARAQVCRDRAQPPLVAGAAEQDRDQLARCEDEQRRIEAAAVERAKRKAEAAAQAAAAAAEVDKRRAAAEAEEQRKRTAIEHDPAAHRIAWSAYLCFGQRRRKEGLDAIAEDRKGARYGGVVDLSARKQAQDLIRMWDRRIVDARKALDREHLKPLPCSDAKVAAIGDCAVDAQACASHDHWLLVGTVVGYGTEW